MAIDAAYGYSVAGVGDVNGDGISDVAIGSPALVDIISGTGTLASVGAVFIYYGSTNGLPVAPSVMLQPTTAVAGALFGYSIAGGDVNGDGINDIVVGAPLDNIIVNGQSGTVGKVYVFNGATLSTTTTPFLNVQLSGNTIIKEGINLSVNALFGFSVAVTEDLNADGKNDIIVGAPTYAGIKDDIFSNPTILDVQSGGAFIFLTNASNNNLSIEKLEPVKSNLLGILTSNINGLLFGYSVDGLGDYNNDGKKDVVATAPAGIDLGLINILLTGKLLQGNATVYYGNGSGVNPNPGAVLTATSGGLLSDLTGTLANLANLFGVSVKAVRDSAGVRTGGLLVGAPLGGTVINVASLELKTGTVSVFKKQASSPSGNVTPNQILSSPP
ncbi:MAG: integrin alpha [Ferruginibacter sp.]